MYLRILCLFLAIYPILTFHVSANSGPPAQKDKKEPVGEGAPDATLIKKLIEQLGSARFSERDAAKKKLDTIGEPALELLNKAAKTSKDLETRRRVQQLADEIDLRILESLFKEGVRLQQTKEYKKSREFFDKAIKKGMVRYHPEQNKAPREDIPFLSEAFFHLAIAARSAGDYEDAAGAYSRAFGYSNYNYEKRRQIHGEWAGMVAQLVSGWKGEVRAMFDKDAAMKKLMSKYSLMLLHSRRYAAGGYLQSAYSFLYETTDKKKHHNDVQLLFDNGRRDKTFGVNMLVGQKNRLADLGTVDFEKNPVLAKINIDKAIPWQPDDGCKAIDGHVYLENVRDDRGNDFFVLFKVIHVEKDSKYVAFLWRRLPGGKIVKRQ